MRCGMVLLLSIRRWQRRRWNLSLKRAVQLAISPEGNTRMRLSAEALKQAESRSVQARAALLPDVSAAFTDQDLTRNLAALGIQVATPIPGFQIPAFVGPFNTMDARVSGYAEHFRPEHLPPLPGVEGRA